VVGLHKQAYEQSYRGAEYRFSQELLSPWYRFVRARLPVISGLQLLEIACGLGALTCLCAERGAQAWGVDLSETALQVGRAYATSHRLAVRFVCASVYEIPFPAETFDLVISCETLEHLQCPGHGLNELRRVIREGGMLLLTTPNYLNMVGLYRISLSLRKKRYWSTDTVQPVEQCFTYLSVARLLRLHGFRVRDMDSMVHRFWIPKGGLHTINALDTWPVARRLLKPFGLHFGFVAQAV